MLLSLFASCPPSPIESLASYQPEPRMVGLSQSLARNHPAILNAQIAALKTQVATLQDQLFERQSFIEEFESLKAECVKKDEEIGTMRLHSQRAQKENYRLNVKVQELIEASDKECKKLKAQIQEMQKIQASLNKKVEELTQARDTFRKECEQLKSQIRQLNLLHKKENVLEIKKAKEGLGAQAVQEQPILLEPIKQKLKAVTEENVALKKAIMKMEGELKSMREENHELKQKYECPIHGGFHNMKRCELSQPLSSRPKPIYDDLANEEALKFPFQTPDLEFAEVMRITMKLTSKNDQSLPSSGNKRKSADAAAASSKMT